MVMGVLIIKNTDVKADREFFVDVSTTKATPLPLFCPFSLLPYLSLQK